MEKTLMEKIREALSKVDENVYYGAVPIADFDETTPWDFIAFNRENTSVSRNVTSMAKAFCVTISREVSIPEGIEEKVIKAMREIDGMKLNSDMDIEFDYRINPNTHQSVELCGIHFCKGEKL